MFRAIRPLAWLSCALLCWGGLAVPSSAQSAREGTSPLDAFAVSTPHLRPAADPEPLELARTSLSVGVESGWAAFQAATPGWQAVVDRQTGFVAAAEGIGIPWIPGRGNRLAAAASPPDLDQLERIARAFLPRVSPLLGIDPAALELHRGRSGQPAPHLWLVDFDVRLGGLPVEGARVVFRVNHGNLVQMGTENLPAPGARIPVARLRREEALAALAEHVDGLSTADLFIDEGSLRLLPAQTAKRRELALVWEFAFRRRGETGTWQARIDAESGKVLQLFDVNRYAQVTGGVYLTEPADGETVMPLPFADLAGGGVTTLSGPYVKIEDRCGAISAGPDWKGEIALGTSGGNDCATPGTGGAGNTHSARTQFYHVNRAKEIGRAWLPGNAWIEGQLRVRVNLPKSCNAYWDGTAVNFFLSSASCGNTGEVPAIALHEYGHGLDRNDGNGTSLDFATGETYGDWTAALVTRDSCIGPSFRAVPCGGYGDPCTSCTGIRDIDWGKHLSNTPHTVANLTQLRCPAGHGYDGPCGREGHCESYVASEALWDFAARDLTDAGSAAAWAIAERLWYLSRSTATSAFTCDTSEPVWTSSGCAAGSLWRTFRFVDDDDGDLTNGTPNSCHLFAAFDRHGIACPSDPGASLCSRSCTPPPAPTATAGRQVGRIALTWTGAGPDVVHDVWRGDAGCDTGLVRIAQGVAGATFQDLAVAPGQTYSYRIVARPADGSACESAPSACVAAAPQPPPCAAPPVPTGLTATVRGASRIDLRWDPVAGAAGYNVYRSHPDQPDALIATVPGTSHADRGLAGRTAYLYKVRAFSAGCESGDSVPVAAETRGCVPTVLYESGFESGTGLAGWSTGRLAGTGENSWQGVQTCAAYQGSGVFRFGGVTCNAGYADGALSYAHPPAVRIPPGASDTRLSFWHRWDFESGYDGGAVGLAVGSSPAFTVAGETDVVEGARPNGVASQECAPDRVGGFPTFTGQVGGFKSSVVSLDPLCDRALGQDGGCAGQTVRAGFLGLADCVSERSGWFLDDVRITTCLPQEDPLDFYTVPPCRLVDTRQLPGPLAGPALLPGTARTFILIGACGIPATARAVAVNLTVFQPGAGGQLLVDELPILSFEAGQVRANHVLLPLSQDGAGSLRISVESAAALHLLVDVTGYFD